MSWPLHQRPWFWKAMGLGISLLVLAVLLAYIDHKPEYVLWGAVAWAIAFLGTGSVRFVMLLVRRLER